MNWVEKIDFMIEVDRNRKFSGKYVIDITFLDHKWEENELNEILKKFPYLNNDYINFIKKYNTIGIAWIVFYGSKKKETLCLMNQIQYWRQEGLPEDYFPFGKGPGGEVYVFDHQGHVIEFADDDYDFKFPKFIANTLQELVDDCLTGKRYFEFNQIENDRYYAFLKHQGWV